MMTTLAWERSTWHDQVPAYLGGAAAATAVVSIAASQILLGMALAALLTDRSKIRWPPFTWALGAFMLWTLVALAASADPAAGLPQIKKFYVYLMLPVVFSCLRGIAEVRWVVLGWTAGAGLSGLWGMVQYTQKYVTTPEFFYYLYSNDRITGFMDHWMTFSGTLMLALMMSGSLLLFSRGRKWSGWILAAAVFMALGILTAYTRTMWLGTAAGAIWLLGVKKRWMVGLVPALAVVLLIANPFSVRERTMDAIWPEPGTFDATTHRMALRASGWEMVKAHPIIGLGPEQVGGHFEEYLPATFPRPIPKEWYFAHLHNVYYHYAAERGIPALLALLTFFGFSLVTFARAVRRVPADSEAHWILHGAIACMIAMAVSGIGEVNLGDSEVLATFLSVVACGHIAASHATSQRDS